MHKLCCIITILKTLQLHIFNCFHVCQLILKLCSLPTKAECNELAQLLISTGFEEFNTHILTKN